jgi:hypothetical protein
VKQRKARLEPGRGRVFYGLTFAGISINRNAIEKDKRLKNGSQAANERFFAFPEIRLFY